MGYDTLHSGNSLSPNVNPSVRTVNRAEDVAAALEGFFEDVSAPFFASAGFFEIHRVRNADTGLFDFAGEEYETPDPDEIEPPAYLPDREGIREDLAEMHGMVGAIDDAVGRITDTLERTGLTDETLIIFTTEHGIAFPRAKGNLFDAGIEAALLLRYPGVIDGGERYDELVSNVDVLPTLLDLLDRDVPENVAGRSFLPLLRGEDYTPRGAVFAEMTWHDRYNPTRAIRTRRYKYIRNFWHLPNVNLTRDIYLSRAGQEVRAEYSFPDRAYEELYDLEEDPHERENLAADPDCQNEVERLRSELRRWMKETGDPLCDGPIPPGDYDRITFTEH